MIATLGRIEDLRDSGQLSGCSVRRALRCESHRRQRRRRGRRHASAARRIGPALVFERLWEETGCRQVIEDLAGSRKHGFPLERAVFLTVLHRLFAGGSDRAADRWREDYAIDGAADIDLHHLYRAMAWLGEELSEDQQDGATLFAPRCLKDVIEEELFARRRNLFSKLDLVFMDTTSLYFEGASGQTLGQRGFSKDHRPDLNQMILAVLLDGDGRPVCTEMWPGNTADVGSLVPVVDRLRKRFSIQRVCVVADRGMISAETIAELEARGLCYILGVRERSDKLVRDLVLADPAPFIPLTIAKRGKEIDYEAKAVMLAGRRYIVCRNREEMKKTPPPEPRSWPRSSVSSRKAIKPLSATRAIGAFSRRQTTTISSSIAPRRRRTQVRRNLRAAHQRRSLAARNHALLQTCGWWSARSEPRKACSPRARFSIARRTIRGHVSCSFLALVLKKELEDRIATLGHASSWPNVLADLTR